MQNITLEQRIKKLTDLGLAYNENAFENEGGYELKDIAVQHSLIVAATDSELTDLVAQIAAHIAANPGEYKQAAQGLTVIDRAAQTLLSGGQLLNNLQLRSSGFISNLSKLKEDIAANGDKINADLDKRANNALLAIKPVIDQVDGDSKEIRQAMVIIRDEFIACTSSLKAEQAIIQDFRNRQAKLVDIEFKRVQEENRKAAERKQEIIDVSAAIEKALLQYFNDYLQAKKLGVNSWFNSITLENFDTASGSLRSTTPKYDIAHFKTFTYRYTGSILAAEDIAPIMEQIRSDAKYNEMAAQYLEQMTELRSEKIDLLSSKKLELEAIAEFAREQEREKAEQARIAEETKTANEERRKQLEEEQRQSEARQREAREKELEETRLREAREKEEAEQARLDHEKKLAEEQSKVDISAAQQTTINMFEQTASSTPSATGPKTKAALKAVITKPVGLYPLFQLWMEGVGMTMTPEELEKEFSKLFTYANKRANAKIPLKIENEFVEYREGLKAVTSKEKKEAVVA